MTAGSRGLFGARREKACRSAPTAALQSPSGAPPVGAAAKK
ncbi:hypothetical protein BH20ACT10_BH20ACT10_04120 [soil metagenome]